MSLVMVVYLIGQLDNIQCLFATSSFISAIISIIAWAAYANHAIKRKTFPILMTIMFCLSLIAAALIPSTKTAYAMAGAYAVEKVENNPKIQAIQGDVLTIIANEVHHYAKETENKQQN